MKTLTNLSLLMLSALAAFGQTPTPPPASTGNSFLSAIASPNTLILASMAASQMADAKTDWHFTAAGKEYTLTPAARLGIAGASFGAALGLEQVCPKCRKGVQVVGVLISGAFAGRALANTYAHGAAPGATTSGAAPKIAFAIQIRR